MGNEIETPADVLQRLGDDAAKWAAEFRATAVRLGYSDMDEGWLIGWFANAIEHSGAVRRWRKDAATLRQQAFSQFANPEALADWLDALHECHADGSVGNRKWEAAQVAARAIRSLNEPSGNSGQLRQQAGRVDVESVRGWNTDNLERCCIELTNLINLAGDYGFDEQGDRTPLPYAQPLDLYLAFKAGAKFVLHYHGRSIPVERMEPREKVVYVQPPGLAVKVFPNGRSAEGPSDAIWLEAIHAERARDGVLSSQDDELAAKRYLRDWVPDSVREYVAKLERLAERAMVPDADAPRFRYIVEFNWIGTKTRCAERIQDSDLESARRAVDRAMAAAPSQRAEVK